MKRMQVLWLAPLLLAASPTWAGWSTNVGWASEYYFRGVFQKASSTSGGIDFEHAGISAGAWAADVGDGLEIDGYFSYSGIAGPFTYGVGFTGYYYTSDFDDTYEEFNLSGGFRFVTIDYAAGRYRNFSRPDTRYGYYAVSMEHEGFHGRFAGFSDGFKGRYVELGYGRQLSEFDVDLTLIVNDHHLNVGGGSGGDETLVFSIGRSFDIR